MYEILYIEVHLELNRDDLTQDNQNFLLEFVNKLNRYDPTLSKLSGEPSRIQEIVGEAILLTEKYKEIVSKQQKYIRKETGTFQPNYASNRRGIGNRGRDRGHGGQQNVRRQSNLNASSWRSRENNTEDSELVEASGESAADSSSQIYQPKKHDNFNNYTRLTGKSKTVDNGNNENEDPVAHKEYDTESKSVQKFQKNKSVQTIRDPYGPNEGGVGKSFERKRIPDKKWVTKDMNEFA